MIIHTGMLSLSGMYGVEAAGIEAARGGDASTRDQRHILIFPLKMGRPSVRASPGASVRFGPFLVPLDLSGSQSGKHLNHAYKF